MSLILGIAEGYDLIYEGTSSHGAHLVWPIPVLTPANFVDATSGDPAPYQQEFGSSFYFREDMFDPLSRIRRGRFYKTNGNTGIWQVLPSPVGLPHSATALNGLISISSVKECRCIAISRAFQQTDLSNATAILGKEQSATLWSIIHVETNFAGEELVTLKARQGMGALPIVNWSKVPADAVLTVREKLSVLEDDYHRAGAESVVDRAREAATAILSGYLQQRGISDAKGKDLGKLISLLTENSGKDEQRVVACAAEIPQRLHSRGKTAEQERRDIRPLREQDAELAMQCIGVMLCDLGWAVWR